MQLQSTYLSINTLFCHGIVHLFLVVLNNSDTLKFFCIFSGVSKKNIYIKVLWSFYILTPSHSLTNPVGHRLLLAGGGGGRIWSRGCIHTSGTRISCQRCLATVYKIKSILSVGPLMVFTHIFSLNVVSEKLNELLV